MKEFIKKNKIIILAISGFIIAYILAFIKLIAGLPEGNIITFIGIFVSYIPVIVALLLYFNKIKSTKKASSRLILFIMVMLIIAFCFLFISYIYKYYIS